MEALEIASQAPLPDESNDDFDEDQPLQGANDGFKDITAQIMGSKRKASKVRY